MKFTYTSGSRPLDGYTIKRGVGHGGFGEVYYAVSDGGKEVALKLVQRNLDVELRGVAQCLNLKHPNLVTLYDLRTNDIGEHWVVMEFVSGKSLSEILEENPSGMPMAEVHRWLKGICAGIGYLHDKGIVHRDLKPGNLFVEDGVVKVGDYGLSKFITASRRSGQTESVGTVHYMAPEISRGKYDREIDVYATGIMLYEMITGHVPFDGESLGEILMKHLTAQPDVTKLPSPYDQVASRALAKDPVQRFRTMEQFAASLNGRLSEPIEPGKLKETVAFVPPPPGAEGGTPDGNASPNRIGHGATLPDLSGPRAWFERMQAKAVAWYERPWTAKDYCLAVLLLVGIGGLGTAVLVSLTPMLVPGLVTLGIILVVLKATRKQRVLSTASPGSPIVLNPVTVAPPAVPSPVVPVAVAPPPAPPVVPPPAVVQPVRFVAKPAAPRELPPKPARTRLVEATTAMLLTTVLAVIAAVLASGLMRLATIEECGLLAATTLAGCWAVLIPAKIWEGRAGDAMLRRLVMAALGVGVGIWCSFLDGVLEVGWLNNVGDRPLLFQSMDWMPKLLADASYFGLVFLIPRWWLLADSRRPLRFNPWMVIVPSFWAWLITLIWSHPYESPHYWGVVVTAMTAALLQLSMPWEDTVAARRRSV
jgi:eukaryotic-like serine/threonine-protein kinase